MFKDVILFFVVSLLVFIINTNSKTTQSVLLQCVGYFFSIALVTMFNSNELIGTYILIIYVGAMSVVFSMAAAIMIPQERYKGVDGVEPSTSEV